ncbi:DUF3667 domain-containing protein [Psychroserpens algicola]|uniref:DUF3667 domain-containing protein n=1 Tax=Psychroserpens algicola TaxID=1719034 RepID=UPI00195317A1|nr:DUF3667 domain-containing protein [Psychroserpens algicola]
MTCNNCETSLTPEQKFCSNCGEIINAKRLQLTSIIGLFFSNFLSYDNKFARTFRELTVKPEIVIDNYVHGFRKKYVNVISYLGLAITLIGLQFFILRRFFPELLSADIISPTNPIKVNNETFDYNSIVDSFYEYQGLLTIVFIPLYAIASKLLFFDSKKYNLAEHFVINIYANAHFFIFWFFVTLLTLPLNINYNILSQLALLPMLVYMTHVFKRLYSIKTVDAFARVVLYYIMVFVVMIIILIIFGIVYGIYLGATGQITPIDMH